MDFQLLILVGSVKAGEGGSSEQKATPLDRVEGQRCINLCRDIVLIFP